MNSEVLEVIIYVADVRFLIIYIQNEKHVKRSISDIKELEILNLEFNF